MARSPAEVMQIERELSEHGMLSLGCFRVDPKLVGKSAPELGNKPALLVGNAGSAMWEVFAQSPECADGKPDPMDCWTRRVLSAIGLSRSMQVRFPFEKPFLPFQKFLHEATGIRQSPLGLYIHPEYGLWHALRGLLVLPEDEDWLTGTLDTINAERAHPCETCLDKPCLSSCPVDAFSAGRLDVEACFGHLRTGTTPDCLNSGCSARNACPVGREYVYEHEHMRFHMRSYFKG